MKKLFLIFMVLPAALLAQSNSVYNASNYNYSTQVVVGNSSTGASSIIATPSAVTQSGIPFLPYNTNASITINRGGSNAETLTPSALTNCTYNQTCIISATFAHTHFAGETIQSGTYGLQAAINAAVAAGSGTVVIDASWQGPSGSSLITAAAGNVNVMIQDNRNPSGAVFYQWNGSAYAASGGGGASLPTATRAGQLLSSTGATNTYVPSQNCIDATTYSGADLGAQINAALAALPTYQDLNNQTWSTGCVRIPWSPTYFTWTTPVTINSPFVSLVGDPSLTQIRYNGTGDMILVQQTQQPSGIHQWQPNSSPTIANLAVLNMTSGGTSGVHIIDTYGVQLHNLFMTAFNGGNGGDQDSACNTTTEPTAYGYWIENYNQFSENTIFDEVEGYDNCIGLRIDIKSGGTGTNSFAYTNFKSLSFGLRANEIGISLENGTFLYNATGRIKLESTSNTAIGMLLSGNATWGSVNAQNGGVNIVNFESECVSGTGCSGGPMTLIENTGTANFTNQGYVNGLSTTTQNVNTSTGQFLINTDSSPSNSLNYHQWAGDGGFRSYFNNTLSMAQYSSNWRMQTNLNMGWSSNVGSTANYLAFGPKSNGSTTFCITTGTAGTCAGNLEVTGLGLNGTMSKYNGTATLGAGLAPVIGIVNLNAQTASVGTTGIVNSVSASDTNAQVRVACSIIPYSGAGSVSGTVSYVDNHSNTQTLAIPSASGTTQQQCNGITVPANGTAISVVTVVTGTITYDLHCAADQLQY